MGNPRALLVHRSAAVRLVAACAIADAGHLARLRHAFAQYRFKPGQCHGCPVASSAEFNIRLGR